MYHSHVSVTVNDLYLGCNWMFHSHVSVTVNDLYLGYNWMHHSQLTVTVNDMCILVVTGCIIHMFLSQ